MRGGLAVAAAPLPRHCALVNAVNGLTEHDFILATKSGELPVQLMQLSRAQERATGDTFPDRGLGVASCSTSWSRLWDCLFLTLPEIAELLRHVKAVARHPFIYPMFCFAAHSPQQKRQAAGEHRKGEGCGKCFT